MADDFPTDEPSDDSPADAGDDDLTHGTDGAQFDHADATTTAQFEPTDRAATDRTTAAQVDRERLPQGAR